MAKIVNTFETGLVKVSNKTKQPKNSYSYALNSVPNDEITDRSTRTNERGFDVYSTLKTTPYNIIGSQWLGDEQYVFFIKHLEGATTTFNEIWYVDIKEGIKELKYSNLDLNFKEGYPITSTYRTDYRNHKLIYWVDGLNDDRVIDIDNPDILSIDISMISMNGSEIKPNISVESVDNAGAVKTGQYFIATAYIDSNEFTTSASNFSKPISIATDNYYQDTVINTSTTSTFVLTNGSELDVVSNKKLTITVSDIDSRYNYIIIYIVQVTDTDTKIYTTQRLNIVGSELVFDFTGTNVPEDSSITINDLVVSRVNYYASNIINQKENRLIRGNLKIKENFINYQQIANNIQVSYDIEEELVSNPSLITNWGHTSTQSSNNIYRQTNSYNKYGITPNYLSKTGNSLEITSKTFMRDEVYALGISFELNDGTETSVFHIPGRPLNSKSGGGILANGTGEYGRIRSAGNPVNWDNDTVDGQPRWLVRNTATKGAEILPGEYAPSELAYWRSDEIYPDGYGYPTDGEKDSNGKSYVRHHKMPSDVLEPIYRSFTSSSTDVTKVYQLYKRNLKLVLDNIVIPEEYQDIIVKVRLHYVKRDDFNKSIVSKGLIYGTGHVIGQDGIRQSPDFNRFGASSTIYQFISPDVDFRHKQFPISAQKFKPGYVAKGYVNYMGESDTADNYRIWLVNNYLFYQNASNPPYTALLPGTVFYTENAVPKEADYSRDIQNIFFTDANSIGTSPDPLIDSSYNFEGESKSSIFNIEYTDTPFSISPSDYPQLNYEYSEGSHLLPDINADGESPSTHIIEDLFYDTVVYGSLVRENRNQYGNVNNLIYIDSGASFNLNGSQTIYNDIEIKNGDCFIDIQHTKKGYSVFNPDSIYYGIRLQDNGNFDQQVPNVVNYVINSYISYFVETDLNIRMRNSDPTLPDPDLDYYPLSPLTSTNIYTSFEKKSTGDEYFNIYPSFNNDHLKEYFANIRTLNEFSNFTNNRYENRLVYSDKQFYEDKIDSFRINRANNYKDLPMDKGQITQSFIKDDKFFVLTRDALYNVYASNKTIQSLDNDNIVVGTGEFFGLEPEEIISIKGGFGGTSSKYSLAESPYGYLYVDYLKSKIIIFSSTLNDINVAGLNESFDLELYKQIKELKLPEKFDSPIVGPGIISIYDPKLHRYIITKKDYKALPTILDNYKGAYDDSEVYSIGDIVAKDGVLTRVDDITPLNFSEVNYKDSNLFENKSFTVSYDPISQSWLSYHSYLPSIYIQHSTDYLKFEDNLNIVKAHSEKYQEDMPFILEFVFNEEPNQTKVFDSITVNGESVYQGVTDNDFFDEVYVYTEQQSSGIIPLVSSGLNQNVTRKEKDWNINKLLDISTNIIPKQLFVKDWDNIKDQYPIDKVINPASIDPNKQWYLRGRFRDKYFVARFKYNNKDLDMKKILVNFVSSTYRVSQR